MLKTLDLSQEITVSYALSNAKYSPRTEGETSTVTTANALRLALDMLQNGFRYKDCEYYSLAALEYLSAVVDTIDGKGVNHD
jgi:hypothetical protein